MEEDHEQVLVNLGLSQNEARVCLALNYLGMASAGQVAAKSGLHRANVYDAIERLVEKGLISYVVRDGTRYFGTAEPSALLAMLKEKETGLLRILPELELNRRLSESSTAIEVFEGKRALRDCAAMIEDEAELRVCGVNDIAARSRLLPGKTPYQLVNPGTSVTARSKARVLPQAYVSDVTTIAGCNCALIILWQSKPLVLRIQNREFSSWLRIYFDMLWHLSKPASARQK